MTKPTLVPMRLKSNGRLILVEAVMPEAEGLEPLGGQPTVEGTIAVFKDALDTIGEVADTIHEALLRMAKRPEAVSVELGVKLTAGGWVILAQAGGEATLKLTLGWKGEPAKDEAADT